MITVNHGSIEDWEMIELNATCLEETLLQQVRRTIMYFNH